MLCHCSDRYINLLNSMLGVQPDNQIRCCKFLGERSVQLPGIQGIVYTINDVLMLASMTISECCMQVQLVQLNSGTSKTTDVTPHPHVPRILSGTRGLYAHTRSHAVQFQHDIYTLSHALLHVATRSPRIIRQIVSHGPPAVAIRITTPIFPISTHTLDT